MTTELRLPGMAPSSPPAQVGTCPECRTSQAVFRYPSRQPPHWYMVAHQHPGDSERVGLGYCAGGGYPALDSTSDSTSEAGE